MRLCYETVAETPAPASGRELDAFRDRADRFIAALDEEYYLHFAGLKETLDLEPIYDAYTDLTELERAQSIGAAVDGSQNVRELWRFACEGHLGAVTRESEEKIARLEAELKTTVDGEEIPFRMLRPAISNEPDRPRRERLERARNELVEEHLNPIYAERVGVVKRLTGEFGAPDYVELYRRFGFRLDDLAEQCRRFLDTTEQLHEKNADRLFRERVGISLSEAQRWDVPRMMRGPSWDDAFPADRMIPALESTLADLGVDLRSQENVHLDVESRPTKDPRAFCAPIEIPEKVMLVIKPMGGPDDWHALFHEAGHTEHYANTSASLSVEEKRLGDNAVTEGWAMLLEHLTDEPAWLTRMLDFPRPHEYAAEGAAVLLYFVRRYCAKLLYELEFHSADDPTTLASRYVELLGSALKVEPSPTDYLGDMDGGFYASAYLRSWALEAQLRSFLREKFGNEWFRDRSAGSLVRELWAEGQRLNGDDLLREVTGASIEMEAVADRARETLA
jgi:hypothetical protein